MKTYISVPHLGPQIRYSNISKYNLMSLSFFDVLIIEIRHQYVEILTKMSISGISYRIPVYTRTLLAGISVWGNNKGKTWRKNYRDGTSRLFFPNDWPYCLPITDTTSPSVYFMYRLMFTILITPARRSRASV